MKVVPQIGGKRIDFIANGIWETGLLYGEKHNWIPI